MTMDKKTKGWAFRKITHDAFNRVSGVSPPATPVIVRTDKRRPTRRKYESSAEKTA